MAEFNPRYMTSIGKYGDEVKLISDREHDFQRYVYERFQEEGYINRNNGYTLAYGPWNDYIHEDWFIPNIQHPIKWNNSQKEWILEKKVWDDYQQKWTLVNKRPDFIFVKNKSGEYSEENLTDRFSSLSVDGSQETSHSTPHKYVIWEVKKAWLYCGSQRCHKCLKHGDRCTSYRYCLNSSSNSYHNEVAINNDDLDYEKKYHPDYYIVQSNSLDGLMSRSEEQLKEYAEMLSMVIPDTSAKIYYRSVIFVLYSRRDPNIAEVKFGHSKKL